MSPNGFDDVLEEDDPLLFGPDDMPNLVEPEGDDSGACASNPFDFAGSGVTFGWIVLSPDLVDGGGWEFDNPPVEGLKVDFVA